MSRRARHRCLRRSASLLLLLPQHVQATPFARARACFASSLRTRSKSRKSKAKSLLLTTKSRRDRERVLQASIDYFLKPSWSNTNALLYAASCK